MKHCLVRALAFVLLTPLAWGQPEEKSTAAVEAWEIDFVENVDRRAGVSGKRND